MRLRLKGNEKEMLSKDTVIKDPFKYKGNFNKLFSNNNPIHIEIGSGKGAFIHEMARNNPNINYVAIEKIDKVLSRNIEKGELDNLRFMNIDAIELDKVFANEVSKIYLNFSDPWSKNKDIKKRLTNKSFLEVYDLISLSGVDLELRTDNKDFFIYSLIELNNYSYSFINIDFNRDSEIKTEYEEKFKAEGKPIYFLKAYKVV